MAKAGNKSQQHQKYVLQCKLWKRQNPFSGLLILPRCPSCSRHRIDKRHLGGYEAALVIASWKHLHCMQYKTWGQDLLVCYIPFAFPSSAALHLFSQLSFCVGLVCAWTRFEHSNESDCFTSVNLFLFYYVSILILLSKAAQQVQQLPVVESMPDQTKSSCFSFS